MFADEDARLAFGDGVIHIDTGTLRRAAKDRKHPPRVDVLIGHEQSLGGRQGQRLARAASAQQVVVLPGATSDPTHQTAAPSPEPSVSPTHFNPIGFRRDVSAGSLLARIEANAPPPVALSELVRTRTGPGGVPGNMPGILASPPEPHVTTAIYDHLGVVDTPDLHDDPFGQATWVVRMAALGVPVLAQLSSTARQLVHPELAHLVTNSTLDDLFDPWRRDRLSVLQRGSALRHHGSAHSWRRLAGQLGLAVAAPTSVSVLLATNRPEQLLDAATRFAAFTYPNRELVVGLHGQRFPDDTAQRLRETSDQPITVLRIDSERNLGQVLNELTSAASGDVISKMDDDDLYSQTHLDDLLNAMRYSSATLAGKGSEFVYLEEIDTTIRRLPNGAESRSRSIGGGTLMIARDDLRSLGGWQQAPRAVDQRLMDDVVAAGGRIHRTHGYGFVLMRGVDGHTWSSDVDYFLRQAVRQWPGLASQEAGIA